MNIIQQFKNNNYKKKINHQLLNNKMIKFNQNRVELEKKRKNIKINKKIKIK